jgi:hypothetical protein
VFSTSQNVSVAVRPDRSASSFADRLPAALALIGAVLLVVQWAHGRMLWLDEEMIALNVRDRSFAQLAGRLSLGQAAPFGWLVLQRAILLTAGAGERALRFVPVSSGVATLGVALWIGRRWMTAWGAAALLFLCAFGQWISFHPLELKHYSADVCFALLLPALAAWTMEPSLVRGLTPDIRPGTCTEANPLQMQRRILTWWVVAAAAQWISNGALFVTPSSALSIVALAARRFGRRAAIRAALPSGLWLASFAANYVVALAPARSNEFLQSYWSPAFPPPGAGVTSTLSWLGAQLGPLAIKPGGSGRVAVFWLAAAVGFAAAIARSAGPGFRLRTARPVEQQAERSADAAFPIAFALVPVAAFAWAAVRLVPLHERLALWMVPAVYVGIALAFERGASILIEGIRRRRAGGLAVGIVAVAIFGLLFADVYTRGLTYLSLLPPTANHELDDRGAVTWLARQQPAGDVWITTHNALPAVWWYADATPLPIVEVSLTDDRSRCRAAELSAWLVEKQHRRALVYLGFGHNLPPGFDDTLLKALSGIGQVVGYRRFSTLGHALVVDLGTPSNGVVTLASLSREVPQPRASAGNACVIAEPAAVW